jgi:alpha-ketoglutaric semialdehyde dehydrogenase
MEKFNNYINGKWAAPATGQYFKNINPANTEDIIGEFAISG